MAKLVHQNPILQWLGSFWTAPRSAQEYNVTIAQARALYVYTGRVGNISDDHTLGGESVQAVCMSRADMAKSRHLATTESGTEIGISLERGSVLRHGDVLRTKDAKDPHVVVRQAPERVALITIPDTKGADMDGHTIPFLLGHVIGNMHRPVSINTSDIGAVASVPIQDDSEIDTLKRAFAAISKDIKMDASQQVFTPHVGADVHGHDG